MNGAESLVRSLLASDVDVCFTNPGTSEMHFVAALDHVPGMRCVLALFEGVATGAADGYWRIARKPASTLLHLGPGLGNGLANLHNAKKAGSGVVNIVGEHAASHIELDAPLAADIAGIAGPVSHWVESVPKAADLGHAGARAVAQARTAPGRIATLILPADSAWTEGGVVADAVKPPAPGIPEDAAIDAAAQALTGADTLLLLGGQALTAENMERAGRIAAATGCAILSEWANASAERGAGRVNVGRVPYPIDQALEKLAPFRRVVLCGARAPIGFFAYPGKPARLTHAEAELIELAGPGDDLSATLEALEQGTGAGKATPVLAGLNDDRPSFGPLDLDSAGAIIAAAIPENAIVVDESVTSGRALAGPTAQSQPHTWLNNCGGSIGYGLPVAIGAAIAAPDRKVLALIGDGSAMYTPQALWTMAREGLDVTALIWANRSYKILHGELAGVGVTNPGPRAIDMLTLDRPALNFCEMARSMGVEATLVNSTLALHNALTEALSQKGPHLIEVMI